MKFLLIICLLLGGCSSPKMKSEILGGKICPFCFADNPIWRKNYCPDCFRVDNGSSINYDYAMINKKTRR